MKGRHIIFRILRYREAIIDPPQFQDFELTVTDTMTVLECLERIRREQDPFLMYRKSCHHASCGTCACVINGTERLACVTPVFALDTPVVTVEPLRGFPCIGDLAVDMTDFYRHISSDWSYLTGVSRNDGSGALRFEDCIECGACVSACPAMEREDAFMGPAALALIHREIEKSPDGKESLLALAGGPHGEQWCERALDCSRVCPSGVYPAQHIALLRKMLGK